MKRLPYFQKPFTHRNFFLSPLQFHSYYLRCILLFLKAYQREINLLISQFKEAETAKVEKLGLGRNIFGNANQVVVCSVTHTHIHAQKKKGEKIPLWGEREKMK